jgi:hypothetical protein
MNRDVITEIVRIPKTSVGVDFSDAPKWLAPEMRDAIGTVRHMNEIGIRSRGVYVVASIIAGFSLCGLKRQSGHGHWGDVREKYIDPIMSERRSQRLMQVAECYRHVVARRAGLPPTRLLACAGMEQDEMDKVRDAILQTAGEKSLSELIQDLQEDNRGGYRPQQDFLKRFCKTPEALKLFLSPETWENWTKAQQQMFRDWAQAERMRQEQEAAAQDPMYHHKRRESAAIRQWEPVITQVKIAVEGRDSWSALPPEKKLELRDKLRSWADLIEKTLAATAG